MQILTLGSSFQKRLCEEDSRTPWEGIEFSQKCNHCEFDNFVTLLPFGQYDYHSLGLDHRDGHGVGHGVCMYINIISPCKSQPHLERFN